MTTTAKPITEVAAYWREARKLYTVYSSLLERFSVGLLPCRELESPIDRSEPESLQNIQRWFAQMDERVHVHQLRQLLQTSRLGTEDNLRSLVNHHLQKETKTESDRDKVDFLLVQYLSSCAPTGFYERDVEFEEVAQVLEPILGEVGLHPPKWLEPLDRGAKDLDTLHSLRDLLGEGILEKMRELKTSAGDMYFGPTALVAIARFNFLVRRTFVRLIAADLHAIRFSINELEQRGVRTVNCVRASLGPMETLENLRQVCQEWKKPFRAAYAAGQNFKELIEIRGAVEEALALAPEKGSIAVPPEADFSEDAMMQAVTDHSSNGAPRADVPPPSTSSAVRDAIASVAAPKAPPSPAPPPPPVFSAPPPTPPAPAATFSPPPAREPIAEKKLEMPPVFQAERSSVVVTPEKTFSPVIAPVPARPVVTPEKAIPSPNPVITTPTPVVIADLQAIQHKIPQELASNNIKTPAVASVTVGNIKLMLSTWEVAAFLKGGDETSETLQRSVAARAFLAAQMELRKHGGSATDLRSAIHVAKYESAKIQARVSVAKQNNDIDSTVNLAATSKRLLMIIEEAEKLAK
ncbi:MAG TPA: hypothetical protein VK738_03890 [Terriglobales bacterium]|jgi:hypothetical protein|nr:hypothetical protein [Terriglobales bacterium]